MDNLLRQVLTVNGWVSGLTGLFVVVFASPVDRWLDTRASGIVRLVGVGLVLFAVVVLATARADTLALRSGGRNILIADIVWVAASIAAVAAGWFSTVGNVVVLLVAAVVGSFAIGEVLGLRRLQTPASSKAKRSEGHTVLNGDASAPHDLER